MTLRLCTCHGLAGPLQPAPLIGLTKRLGGIATQESTAHFTLSVFYLGSARDLPAPVHVYVTCTVLLCTTGQIFFQGAALVTQNVPVAS